MAMGTSDATLLEDNNRMTNLLRGGKYSDFTVRCGDRVWKAHRAILCARSKYFETFCESSAEEVPQITITFEEEDPDLIEQMLLYLYTSQYSTSTSQLDQDSLARHVRLYAVANKYDLPLFPKVVKHAFAQDLGAKGASAKELVKVTRLVYTTTPDADRGLRDLIQVHLWQSSMLSNKDVQKCVLEVDGLRVDVLKMLFASIHTLDSLKKSGRKSGGSCILFEA